MIKKIIFLGPPGVGKGTIAKILEKEKGIVHISTGEIFRKEISQKTKIGLKIKSIILKGGYVVDEITNKVVEKNLKNKKVKKNGFILDGYPRTIEQAKFLESINLKLDAVILFVASKNIIKNRLLNRGRKDDNHKIIKKRIEIYNTKTKPLINFYKEKNLLFNINVEGTIEDNYKNFLSEIS
jgi:adenylate kinase